MLRQLATGTARTMVSRGAYLPFVSAALLGVTLVTPVDAAASMRHHGTVRITATEETLLAPGVAELEAGLTIFRVRTPDPAESHLDNHWVGLVELEPNVALDRYAEKQRDAIFAEDPAVRAAAQREVDRISTPIGGVAVHRNAPQAFTKFLAPGEYYLLDYQLLTKPNAATLIHKVTVSGWQSGQLPPLDGTVVGYYGKDGKPQLAAPQRLDASSALLVVNGLNERMEAMFLQVADGTTDADIQEYFDDVAAGKNPPPPFIAGATGMLPIGPGESLILRLSLPPGTYALIDGVDTDDGRSHVELGAHAIVVVR